MKTKMDFRFCFHYVFHFRLGFCFCIFVNSTWPRGAVDGQLSLHWPRSAIAFLVKSRWPSGVIDGQLSLSLLIGLEVP